ncbi:MAG: nitrile hydratase subunit beta [Acidobacteriia bacterium]|nr:nitrile hydratase subunit beta [Terriglobia bacterium]
MNGIHDMGGMQDMGPIRHEADEPVFHEPWEGRVYAIDRALRALGKWNLDATRYETELLPAADYLQMSYYERQFRRISSMAVKYGLITQAELENGKPEPGSPKATPALTAVMSSRFLNRGVPSSNEPSVRPLFKAGQRVRARNINPMGHTRLPRYARGKVGFVERDHGVYDIPDTVAHFQGTKRQHVYSVRFSARELWGNAASPRDAIHVDMWDDYLEPA